MGTAGIAPDHRGATARRQARGRTVAIGVIGAMVFVGGVGLFLAFGNPAYQQDESSHVGYSLSLRQGVLPSIDTRVPTDGGGEFLKAALSRSYPFSNPDIHVANNPPFPYLVALPLTEVTTRLGVPGGPLLALRLLNLAGSVAAIGLAFLLGRELSGGKDFVGLVTAGLLSGVIGIAIVSATANVDGPAFAATTGVTWALARFARTRATRDATWLGLWCAGAAAVRPMSLVYAAVAGVLALFLGWRARGSSSIVPLTIRLAVPTVVLTGWFYLLNIGRYGDFTGSQALADKLGLRTGPSLFHLLTGPQPFVQTLTYLVSEVYGRSPWWLYSGAREYLVTALAVALLAGAITLSVRSSRTMTKRAGEQTDEIAVESEVDRTERSGLVPGSLDLRHDPRRRSDGADRATRTWRWRRPPAVPPAGAPDRRGGGGADHDPNQPMACRARCRRIRHRTDHAHPRRRKPAIARSQLLPPTAPGLADRAAVSWTQRGPRNRRRGRPAGGTGAHGVDERGSRRRVQSESDTSILGFGIHDRTRARWPGDHRHRRIPWYREGPRDRLRRPGCHRRLRRPFRARDRQRSPRHDRRDRRGHHRVGRPGGRDAVRHRRRGRSARAGRTDDPAVRPHRLSHEQCDGPDPRDVRRVDRRDVGRVDEGQRAEPLPADQAGRAVHDRAGRREHHQHVVAWRRPRGDAVHAARLRDLLGRQGRDGAIHHRAGSGARRPRHHRQRAAARCGQDRAHRPGVRRGPRLDRVERAGVRGPRGDVPQSADRDRLHRADRRRRGVRDQLAVGRLRDRPPV